MSFILDALKKSEQERQRRVGSAPPPRKRTVSLERRCAAGRRWWWLAILPVVVIAGWLLVGDGFSPAERSAELANRVAQPVRPAAVQPPPVASQATAAEAAAASQGGAPGQIVPLPVPSVEPAPVPRVEKPLQESVARSSRRLSSQPQQHPEASVAVPRYLDLATATRDRMPRLTMSLHFYAVQPKRRLVRINNRLLHEGDLVSDQLQVVEILPTGVLLDYLGLRFELPGGTP
jgi:general secretion pathway protein B